MARSLVTKTSKTSPLTLFSLGIDDAICLSLNPQLFSDEQWASIEHEAQGLVNQFVLNANQLSSKSQSGIFLYIDNQIAVLDQLCTGFKALGLDMVFDATCQLIDSLYSAKDEMKSDALHHGLLIENFIDQQRVFKDLDNVEFMNLFLDVIDCFKARPFVGKGRYGHANIYSHGLTNTYRLSEDKSRIFVVYKENVQKIISIYSKKSERRVECKQCMGTLWIYENEKGKQITYFDAQDVQSNIYHIKTFEDNRFEFLFMPGGKRVPSATIFENKLYFSDDEDDVASVSKHLIEKNGFYYAKGEKTPFFMSVVEVESSSQHESVDRYLGINKSDKLFGKRVRDVIRKIGYPYSYDTFGKETVKFSVKSEGVCLITIGFHSFPLVDLSLTSSKPTRPMLEIVANSKTNKKSYYVNLPDCNKQLGVYFLKSPANQDYLLTENHLYKSNDHYFTLAVDNIVVEQLKRKKMSYQLKGEWQTLKLDQKDNEFNRGLFDQLMEAKA